MSLLEIILLVVGAVLFVVSFLIPEKEEKLSQESRMMAKKEIRKMVSEEMEAVRNHVDELVDETVNYAMEKTERSMERLSNEKIMAVSEYSEIVLKEINKNYDEVMFLYDMLNDKHVNLKNTVSEANKAAKEVVESTREAEAFVNTMQSKTPEAVTTQQEQNEEVFTQLDAPQINPQDSNVVEGYVAEEFPEHLRKPPTFGRNSNDKVLELYGQGVPTVDIAKQLGLGVGEVKLVIDLYKNEA